MTDVLLQHSEALARIETKVDVLVESRDDHEQRIRSNERWRLAIPGSVIAGLLAVLGIHLPVG